MTQGQDARRRRKAKTQGNDARRRRKAKTQDEEARRRRKAKTQGEDAIKLGFHRYGCGMQMRMRLADASSGMRFV